MKTKININGEEVEITLTEKQIASIRKGSPMDKVYTFHGTTEEEFNDQYRDVSEFAKYQEIERMIVNFYNKGVEVDFDNKNQPKYFLWFNLGENFSLFDCRGYFSAAAVSARLCFIRKEDALDAVKNFLPQYRNSRNNVNL